MAGSIMLNLASVGTMALGQPLPDHLQRLRSFTDREPPTSLADAAALHVEAKRRAGRIQQHYGHRLTVPSLPPITRQLATTVGAAIIRPSDFGADPTGVRDSTAELQRALTAARTQNTTLFVPLGCYTVTDTLNATAPRNGRWQAQANHASIGGFATKWEAGVAVAQAVYTEQLKKKKACGPKTARAKKLGWNGK